MTPIIFITAYGSDEIPSTDLYAEGAVDFIFAPVPPDELRAKVSVFANLFVTAAAARRTRPRRCRRPPTSSGCSPTPRRSASSRPTPRTGTSTRTRAGPRSPASHRDEAVGQAWETIIERRARAGLIVGRRRTRRAAGASSPTASRSRLPDAQSADRARDVASHPRTATARSSAGSGRSPTSPPRRAPRPRWPTPGTRRPRRRG